MKKIILKINNKFNNNILQQNNNNKLLINLKIKTKGQKIKMNFLMKLRIYKKKKKS